MVSRGFKKSTSAVSELTPSVAKWHCFAISRFIVHHRQAVNLCRLHACVLPAVNMWRPWLGVRRQFLNLHSISSDLASASCLVWRGLCPPLHRLCPCPWWKYLSRTENVFTRVGGPLSRASLDCCLVCPSLRREEMTIWLTGQGRESTLLKPHWRSSLSDERNHPVKTCFAQQAEQNQP